MSKTTKNKLSFLFSSFFDFIFFGFPFFYFFGFFFFYFLDFWLIFFTRVSLFKPHDGVLTFITWGYLLDWSYDPNGQQIGFYFLIIIPYLGAYLIGLTIISCQKWVSPFSSCLDLPLTANSSGFNFYSSRLTLNCQFFSSLFSPRLTLNCQFFKFSFFSSRLTFDCQLFKFSFFHLDLPLIANSSNFHFLSGLTSDCQYFSSFFFTWTYLWVLVL